MAFSTPLVDERGVHYYTTYCRVHVIQCTKNETVVRVTGYKDASCAPTYDNPGKMPVFEQSIPLTTDMALQAANPISYAYVLLEQSGVFPQATWNI